MASFLCVLALLLCSYTASFQTVHQTRVRSRLFYKNKERESSSITHQVDNFLGEPTFQFQRELWSQEWHDSFVRNGLVDFVPPLSSQLNCLLVGGTGVNHYGSAPIHRLLSDNLNNGPDNYTDSTARQDTSVKNPIDYKVTASLKEEEADSFMLSRLLDGHLISNHENPTHLDCIFDRGLMDELLQVHADRDVGLLLLEATRHIREHGVYVVVTKEQLPDETKEYLVNVGSLLGMQWRFDLDGISDENATVSVARKYFTGELPTVGKLATVKRTSMP